MDFPTSAKLNINNFDANGVNNQPLNHVPVIDKYIMLIITIKHALSQKIYMSRLMGKPTICIGENKAADQLRGYREADQRLCFCYTDSTFPLLPKSEISSF